MDRKEYNKKHYEANKEKILERTKKRYEANKEKELELSKKRYETNKTIKNEHEIKRIYERKKKWREDNKEKVIKKRKEWQENGIENWLKVLHSNCKRRIRDGFVCDITLEDMITKYNEQNGLCAITNVKMSHKIGSLDSVSIDRIDNTIGYTKENIHLVTKWINLGKNTASLDAIKTAFQNAVRATMLVNNSGFDSSRSLNL